MWLTTPTVSGNMYQCESMISRSSVPKKGRERKREREGKVMNSHRGKLPNGELACMLFSARKMQKLPLNAKHGTKNKFLATDRIRTYFPKHRAAEIFI